MTDRRSMLFPITATVGCTVAMAALFLLVGDSLGLWLGGIVLVGLLLPGMAPHRKGRIHQFLDAAAVPDVVAAVWLLAMLFGVATAGQWLRCAVLLYAFAAAVFGAVMLLHALRVPPLVSVLAAVTMSLAWLAAPVWLAAWMNDAMAEMLGQFHPLLAVNGVRADLGIWLEQPRVYRHTVLGQDVAYALAQSVVPSTLMHLSVGAVAGGLAWAIRRASARWSGGSSAGLPLDLAGVEPSASDRSTAADR